MGIIDYFLGRKPNKLENPAVPITAAIIREQNVAFDTSPQGALRLAPIIAGERFLSESIASLPLMTYRDLDDGGRERAKDHPLYTLLHDRPNEYQTPSVWKTNVIKSLIRKGNSYNYIERNVAGEPVNLLPLVHGDVKVRFAGTKRFYWQKNGGEYEIPTADILHFFLNSDDGIVGQPLFANCSMTLELAFAAEQYGLTHFTEGTTSPEHIELAEWPTADKMAILKDSMSAWVANRHGTRLIPGGKLVKDGYSNQESQYIELRKYQLLEIARVYRVAPYVIQHYENGGTYANLEAQSIDLVQNSLQPFITPIEEEIGAKLMGKGLSASFLIDSRLRGDTKSRYDAYAIAIDKKILTVDEVRALENRPAHPKEQQPQVNASADQPQTEPEPTEGEPQDGQ